MNFQSFPHEVVQTRCKRVQKGEQIHSKTRSYMQKKGIGGNLPPIPHQMTADADKIQEKWTKGSSQAYVVFQSNIFSPHLETEYWVRQIVLEGWTQYCSCLIYTVFTLLRVKTMLMAPTELCEKLGAYCQIFDLVPDLSDRHMLLTNQLLYCNPFSCSSKAPPAN